MTRTMIKLVTAILLLAVLFSPAAVYAQSGLRVVDRSAEAGFPLDVQFFISAESDRAITDIRLNYRTEREGFARVTAEVYVPFAPDTSVDVRSVLDMIKTGGLPPGSSLDYWWTVEDASGRRIETVPASLRFEDDRYDWQSLTEGNIILYWYEGNYYFSEQLMATAQEALVRLSEDTGAYLSRPVEIYIYASSRDLQGAMIFPQEWTGGVTYAEYGVIAIGIDPDNLDWGKRAMTHELTHLVIHQMTFNPYIGLPTWLDEGLAMYSEGILDVQFSSALIAALEGGSLISARSLSSPFSADSAQASLSYAQSYSLVEFLISSYGQGEMLDLLTTFSRGSDYDDALEEVYGFDTDGLNDLWREWITGRYLESGLTTASLPPAPAVAGR